jgi:hypothetical protein
MHSFADLTDCSDGDADTDTDMRYRGECVGGSAGAPDAFMVLGESGTAPYVWSWNP